MTAYRYIAADAGGGQRNGIIEADSPRAARSRLREQNLLPIEIATEKRPTGQRELWRHAIPVGELALFSRQFATLLHAGLTIDGALSALLDDTEQSTLRAALQEVRQDVLAGHNLAAALEHQSRAFPRYYAAIIRAGEEAGALAAVMERLAAYLERGNALRHKVTLAMVYPAIVTVVASLVVGVLLTYVVPQLVSVFEHSNQALPWLTRVMIGLSDLVRATWWIVLALLAAAGFSARQMLKLAPVRLSWHRFLLGLPVIGRLRNGVATARFANTLAVLVGSGVPAVKALNHAADALDDMVFRAAVAEAAARVREGMGISRALREARVFPPLVLHLIASGEVSGELARVLEQAARQQEMTVEARLATFTALLEPLLILAMGGMVLLIVLATMEPIIEMNRLLK
ncbi:MAG: type II secretion system inner membrane protein GspF [Gallionellaceae bacterium]|nr:type II secretion system inner membrane protein GspF [Gallionellaceae bacterium]